MPTEPRPPVSRRKLGLFGVAALVGAGLIVATGMKNHYFGNDQWAGGTNNAPYARDVHLAGATVTVDGATLVDKGALKP